MPTLIPSLPEHLREVPDILERGDERARSRWMAWRDAVLVYRELMHRNLKAGKISWDELMPLLADDPAYALLLFGYVYEPRLRGGRGGTQPFIPFGWQVDLIRWFERRMELDFGDGYVSKSRGIGATWIFCWIALHGWLFKSPFDSLLISRNAEQVDRKGDKKSMFNKVDFFFDHLPNQLKPVGYNADDHRTIRLMVNPANGNTISGDATTIKAGRGDRVTFALYDEAAAIPDFDATWGTGGGTTDHRFAISTESMEEGGIFNAMWTSAKASNPDAVFELDWWRNPYFDTDWYAQTYKRHADEGQAHVFEREYGRNMMAGVGSYIYEYARTIKERDDLALQPGTGRMLYCAVDPGVNDSCALVWVQYDPGDGVYDVLDAYMRSGQDSRYFVSIMLGIPVSGPYDYDQDALDIMRWTSRIRDPIIYVGDPYGDNRGGESAKSFYEGIAERSAELSDGATRILVRTSWEPEDRGLTGRQEALRDMLPRSRFANTPRVRRVVAALKEYRNQDIKDSRETTRVVSRPIRIAGDHYIAALEYLAVHRRVGLASGSNVKRALAQRQTVAGINVNKRQAPARVVAQVGP